ncbi:MAG TPA: apolipoprotein N-acyltransferase [Gammaproteobacteria bacterium]|nr:apolipoprotein N-acyltransferase [Gammaproteobacteria bacterium]
MTRTRAHYLLAIVAGAASPLAFAPFNQFWLAPLSYAALLYVWSGATPRRAFGLGLAYGCASFGLGTYWTYIAVRIIGQAPVFVGVTLTVGLVVVLAAFIAVAGFAAARAFRTSGAVAWLATVPALFVLTEWLRGWLFTGFGWLAAGYSQTDSWLMGYAPLGGIHLMSSAVLVTAGALLTLWLGSRRERAVAAIVIAAVWLGGLALRGRDFTEPKETPLEVALATAAVPQVTKYDPAQLEPTLALYAELTRQGAGADLIIWPEAAIPIPIELVSGWLETVRRQAAERGSTLVLGALRTVPAAGGDATETYENVVLALTDEPQVYVKRHLVPFGEFYPVPDFVRNWMRLMNLPYIDLAVGADDQPLLAVAGERLGVTICYEDVFGAEQLRHLADTTLLVNVSNDGWFGESIAIPQHLQIARVRAAEAGRYLVRAANRGITAVIDPHGRLVDTIEPFHAGVLKATVRGYTGATPYARIGDWLVVVAAMAALLAVRAASLRRATPASADLRAAR